MVAVIVVGLIIGAFILSRCGDKTKTQRYVVRGVVDREKTHATLENKLFETYKKHGLSIADCYRNTCGDMHRLGYVPCIPIKAYSENKSMPRDKANRYNSHTVRILQELCLQEFDMFKDIKSPSDDMVEEWVYGKFPVWSEDLKEYADTLRYRKKAKPKGSFIYHVNYGMCEVIGYTKEDTYMLRKTIDGSYITVVRYDSPGLRED